MYLGLLGAFEAHHFPLNQIEGFGGVSIGALVALMLALKMPTETMRELCGPLLHDGRVIAPRPDVSMLVNAYGLDDGRALRDLLRAVLERGGLSETIRFADLRRLLHLEFACIGTDLLRHERRVFSAATTPDLAVLDAVYMSMSVPFLFVPRHYDGAPVVDGALSEEVPDLFPHDATLYVGFAPRRGAVVDHIVDYFAAVFSYASGESEWYCAHECIVLDQPDALHHVSALALDTSHHGTAQQRIRLGYAWALEYLFPGFMQTVGAAIRCALEAHCTPTDGAASCASCVFDSAGGRCT